MQAPWQLAGACARWCFSIAGGFPPRWYFTLSMILNLTPAGEQAIWAWVCSIAKNAHDLNRHSWLADARKQLNLSGKDDFGHYRIWISGAESLNGHLHALVLKPGWFRILPKPVAPAGSGGLTFF